jgi:glycosyltransferase involved in cell wall biosynthesis
MTKRIAPKKILVCGMPRSMTTWIFNVLDILLPINYEKVWIDPSENSPSRYLSSGISSLGKCHFYSDELAIESDIVIYSYRDIRLSAISYKNKFNALDVDVLAHAWEIAGDKWMPQASLIMRYEDVTHEPTKAVEKIRAILLAKGIIPSDIKISKILNTIEERFDSKSKSEVVEFSSETMILPAHRTYTPSLELMSAGDRKLYKEMTVQFHPWLVKHGYETAKSTRVKNENIQFQIDERIVRSIEVKEAAFRQATNLQYELAYILKGKDEALKNSEAGLSAKEAVIQELRTAYEGAQKTNKELERSRASLIEDISSIKQLLSAAEAKNETGLSAKEAVIQELRTAYEGAQKTNKELERSLRLELEKNLKLQATNKLQEAQEQELHYLKEELLLKNKELIFVFDAKNTMEAKELLKSTVKSLEDKEKVINELSVALNAYRAAYERTNIFKNSINKLIHLDGVKNTIHNFLKPKIGNLNQHAPREIQLSNSYYKKRKLGNIPKLSIVTPSFNQGHFIGRTIESILGQNYENLEYVIQDGGSTDCTVSVIQGYERAHAIAWESVADNGQSHALNLAFKKCTGDILAWVNSDDVLLSGAIDTVISYFNQNPEVDVVYGNRLLIDETDLMIGRWILPGHDNEVLSFADYIPQETMFFRRSIWDASGSHIDENFRFAMDWDLILRFREAGAKFAHLTRYLGGFRIHENQKTSSQINEVGIKEMDILRKRCIGYIPDHNEIFKKIKPFLIKHKIKHANLTFKEFIRRRL